MRNPFRMEINSFLYVFFFQIRDETINVVDFKDSSHAVLLPNFKIPIASSTQPAKNAKIIANSGGLSTVYCNVSNAIRLVGPIDTSFIVPKNT